MLLPSLTGKIKTIAALIYCATFPLRSHAGILRLE
jgi:hypothetical protein